MLLPAYLPFLFQLCLKLMFIECRVPERQGTDSSASFILFSVSSSPYVESVSTLPCLGLTVVSGCIHKASEGPRSSFLVGGAKLLHVLQLSCLSASDVAV